MGVVGLVVRISDFHSDGPGSIPGWRITRSVAIQASLHVLSVEPPSQASELPGNGHTQRAPGHVPRLNLRRASPEAVKSSLSCAHTWSQGRV